MTFEESFKMMFIILLFYGMLGLPTAQKPSDDLDFEIEELLSILRIGRQDYSAFSGLVGGIGGYFSGPRTSCPYTHANRCDIKIGTLFSRSKCEWIKYYEECDNEGSNKCQGYFKSLKDFYKPGTLVEWNTFDDSYDDLIIDAIRNLFPGVSLEFEKVQSRRRRSYLPTFWSGPKLVIQF